MKPFLRERFIMMLRGIEQYDTRPSTCRSILSPAEGRPSLLATDDLTAFISRVSPSIAAVFKVSSARIST
jgi:hypothetical protein